MNSRNALLAVAVLGVSFLTACSKKDDAPSPHTPSVSGTWTGTGTDDSIGYYQMTMTLTQSGTSASGTYATASSYGTTSGNVSVQLLSTNGGNNVSNITMTRTSFSGSVTCDGTGTLSQPTSTNDSTMGFYYKVSDCRGTNNGGATVTKTIAAASSIGLVF